MKKTIKVKNKENRKRRIRAKVTGTSECPRLSIFSSNSTFFSNDGLVLSTIKRKLAGIHIMRKMYLYNFHQKNNKIIKEVIPI